MIELIILRIKKFIQIVIYLNNCIFNSNYFIFVIKIYKLKKEYIKK